MMFFTMTAVFVPTSFMSNLIIAGNMIIPILFAFVLDIDRARWNKDWQVYKDQIEYNRIQYLKNYILIPAHLSPLYPRHRSIYIHQDV